MIKKIDCIEIPVSDMNKSIDFYENVLGLKMSYEHPLWTCFDIEGISFALAASGTKGRKKGEKLCRSCSLCVLRFAAGKMKQDEKTPTATSVVYLKVDDLDAAYQELKDKGVEFISGPKKQGWGNKTAVMLDPDKNILVLTQ